MVIPPHPKRERRADPLSIGWGAARQSPIVTAYKKRRPREAGAFACVFRNTGRVPYPSFRYVIAAAAIVAMPLTNPSSSVSNFG